MSTPSANPQLRNHPPAKIEAYVFSCDASEILARIRSLDGCRVREGRDVEVACRVVWHNATALFRFGYEGVANAEDDGRLKMALAADERQHPTDYQAHVRTLKPARRSRSRDDDGVMISDFIDPRVDAVDDTGNLILASRRTVRLRDRASLDELDAIATYHEAQKAIDPAVRVEFVSQSRWALVR